LANEESQISAIPPERYGDRFLKFLSSVTKTREAAEREKAEESAHVPNDPVLAGINDTRSERESTEKVLHNAHNQAEHTKRHGATEDDIPRRELRIVRSPSAERGELGTTLPVVEEAHETSSTGGRSARSTDTNIVSPPLRAEDRGLSLRPSERDHSHGRPPPTPPKDSGTAASEERPPTPPKDVDGYNQRHSGPPTPPKEVRGRAPGKDKELPHLPPLETVVRIN
jgi:1-phosphatidylinositol-4-phosphate 5-kinase